MAYIELTRARVSCIISLFESYFDQNRAADFEALTTEPDEFGTAEEDPEPCRTADELGEADDEDREISRVSFEELKKALPSLTRSVSGEILWEVSLLMVWRALEGKVMVCVSSRRTDQATQEGIGGAQGGAEEREVTRSIILADRQIQSQNNAIKHGITPFTTPIHVLAILERAPPRRHRSFGVDASHSQVRGHKPCAQM